VHKNNNTSIDQLYGTKNNTYMTMGTCNTESQHTEQI